MNFIPVKDGALTYMNSVLVSTESAIEDVRSGDRTPGYLEHIDDQLDMIEAVAIQFNFTNVLLVHRVLCASFNEAKFYPG